MIFHTEQLASLNSFNEFENEIDYYFLKGLPSITSSVYLGEDLSLKDFLFAIKASLNKIQSVLIVNNLDLKDMKFSKLRSSHLTTDGDFIFLSPSVRKKIIPEMNDKLLEFNDLKNLLNQQLKEYLT